MALVVIALSVTLIQLSGVYLRYLPFRADLTDDKTKNFWRKIFALSAVLFSCNIFLFEEFGIVPLIYKSAFALGWFSYVGLSVILIRQKFAYHIFVVGMQGLWSIMLHTMASIFNSLFLKNFSVNEIFLHSALYLFLFLILLRAETEVFKNILSAQRILEKQFKWYVAILPLTILFGIVIPMVDDILIHSFKQRILRFLIPLFFFLIYRSFNMMVLQIDKKNQQAHLNQLLNQKLQTLKEHNLLIEENQKQLAIFRHDLRHNYRLIAVMLNEGKVSKAIKYILHRDKLLSQTETEEDMPESLLDSVILIYRRKAQDFSIKFETDIKLLSLNNSADGDIIILLSNLLDNAINASKKQPLESREITVMIAQIDKNISLEVSNRYDEKIILDKNGFPNWKFGGGMNTLLTFQKKYDAEINFVQSEGKLKILILWNDVRMKK